MTVLLDLVIIAQFKCDSSSFRSERGAAVVAVPDGSQNPDAAWCRTAGAKVTFATALRI